jgi:phosphopantothenoylcysteine decarboxylase/phosphopantothenate--cysteine ligase
MVNSEGAKRKVAEPRARGESLAERGQAASASLAGKCVLVGVTGSIACYKAVEVVRRLVELGAEVHVLMTRSAAEFVTPLTFQTLSRNPVVLDMFAAPARWEIEHVELASRADLFLIAPATAHCLARLALGLADEMISATALSTRAPVLVAPAMDAGMWLHEAVQQNVQRLRELGCEIIEPAVGKLASGKEGPGRFQEPEEIVRRVVGRLAAARDLEGKTILVTAGPTQEPLDAVRHISNPSTGKMGFALAKEAAARGAKTTLVAGPTILPDPAGVETVRVKTAAEMLEACLKHAKGADAVLMAAAVSDYRPKEVAKGKPARKASGSVAIELSPTPDILKRLAALKGLPGKRRPPTQPSPTEGGGLVSSPSMGEETGGGELPRRRRTTARPLRPLLVGFAAEAGDAEKGAGQKLKDKGLDMIVANDITRPGAGFGSDTNDATLIFADGRKRKLPMMPKERMAGEILNEVARLLG